VIAANANTRIAQAGWFPSLTATVGGQKEFLLPPLVAQTTGSFVLSERVFDLTRTFTIDQRKSEERGSEDDLEDQVLTILQTTVSSYFAAATSSVQAEIYKKRIERLKNFLAVVEELARLHVSDRTSVYNLSSELSQTQSDLMQLQLDLTNSMNQFYGYIGGGDRQNIQLQTKYTLPKNIKADPKKIANQLPVVQSLHAQNEALQSAANAARSGYLPTVSVNATYSPSKLNYSTAASVSPDGLSTIGGYNPSSFTVQGLLTWNIFDQGVKFIQSQQYDAQASTAESLEQARQDQNELQLATLIKQYGLSLQSLAMTNERYRQASEAFESSMALFQIGKISYLLVKDSESALFGAELEERRIELQAALISSEINLYSTYENGHYRRLTSSALSCATTNY
jgi:outer membrane protein TolC